MGRGIMSFVAGLASGALKQYNSQQEQERLDKAEKRADEEHTARMQERNDVISERREMAQAARPLNVIEGAPATPGGAPMTLPASMDERDIGTPGAGVAQAGVRLSDGQTFTDRAAGQAAAAAGSTPDAIRTRQAEVMARRNPLGAEQLLAAGEQRKAAAFTLSREQERFANEKFNNSLATITDAADIPAVGSMLFPGMKVTVAKNEKGDNQIMLEGPDGKQRMWGKAFGDKAEDVQGFLVGVAKDIPITQKVQAWQSIATFKENQRQFAENKTMQQQQITEQSRHNKASERISGANLVETRELRKIQAQDFTLRENADTRAAETHRYNTETLRSIPALERPIVQGMQDGIKTLQAQIVKMQGDDTKEWDPTKNKGQALLEKKLETAQLALSMKLQSITPAKKEATPRADNNPSAVTGSVAAKGLPPGVVPGGVDTTPYGGKAPPAAAAAAPATAVDPMRQQYAKESSDLNRGKREDFSPEVKAYIKRIKAEEQAQADAARAEEGRRAAAASRGLGLR